MDRNSQCSDPTDVSLGQVDRLAMSHPCEGGKGQARTMTEDLLIFCALGASVAPPSPSLGEELLFDREWGSELGQAWSNLMPLHPHWPALSASDMLCSLEPQSLCTAIRTVENIHPHFPYPPPHSTASSQSSVKVQLKSRIFREARPDEAFAPALSPALVYHLQRSWFN